ncbi:MAG: DUF262 domain-containing protein [Pseudohongiellaceae bacterium]
MNNTQEEDWKTEGEEEEDEVTIDYEILSYPSDFTLSGIEEKWKNEDIVIPDYQRDFVWKRSQSSVLIDSFLRGLPVPPVFFYVDEDNKSVVIDGQQRILSVIFFFEGHFGKESNQKKRQVFRLIGLDEKSPYVGKRFVDLAESDQRKLKDAVLRSINIRQLNPENEQTSAYHIFERLNTGGTPLKPQEIRNCLFRKGLSSKLKELNQDANWRLIIGKEYVDKHQRDIELVLRVFSLVGAVDKYESPMKVFLNNSMKNHDEGNTPKVRKFLKQFPKTTKLVVEKFGEKPFHLRGPLNISVLDSVMNVVSEHYGKLDFRTLKKRYKKLVDNKRFEELTTLATTDTKVVRERIDLVREHLVD